MGNQVSMYGDTNVFHKDLQHINEIVNSIISEKNVFNNRDYNFLSNDVCNEHYLLMENELNRHLKVEVQNLGTSLYIIPKDSELTYQKKNINKKEICKKISQHYMKILYILCLIKYVYNLEKLGEYSISGILFRNIKVVDNIMEINFCNVPQKDYTKSIKDAYKLDFSKLEGLHFLTQYFLDPAESSAFIKVFRRLLARSSKTNVNNQLCEYIQSGTYSVAHIKQMEKMFYERFNQTLTCRDSQSNKEQANEKNNKKKVNLTMFVDKDNPIFSKEFCYEMHKYVIQLNMPYGKKVLEQYTAMRSNNTKNMKDIEKLVDLIVLKNKDGSYSLKDIDRISLDKVIYEVKDTIKTYYIQSIADFQKLLDIGKNTPNINIIK